MAEVSSSSAPPAMEDHFVPSTPLEEVMMGVEAYQNCLNFFFEEVELTESGQEMLRNGKWNWPAFRRFVRGKIGWLGEGMLVDGTRGGLISWFDFFAETGFNFLVEIGATVRNRNNCDQLEIWASPEATQATQTAVCDIFLQVFTRNKSTDIIVLSSDFTGPLPIHSACPFSGPALARFLTKSPDIPEIMLVNFELDEEHCRVIVATEDMRENFEINLYDCRFTEGGERVLCDGIRRNRGPTDVVMCHFNTRALAEALRGNSRIKIFESRDDVSNEDALFLFRATRKTLASKHWISRMLRSLMKAGTSCASRLRITPPLSFLSFMKLPPMMLP